jgi:hypothetical protein
MCAHTHLLHDWLELMIVHVTDSREKMVFNLIVKAAVKKSQNTTAYCGGGLDLEIHVHVYAYVCT